MPDYQNAMIYKLWCPDNDLVYYGSTVNRLSKRLNQHKCKSHKCKSHMLFESSNDVRIELVEKFPCNDKNELNAREGYYIKNFDCVNRCVAGRTRKEFAKKYREEHKEEIKKYREKNREERKEYRKKYYEQNKEKINEKQREYNEQNKEKINEKKREYYEQNKEKIKEKHREKIKCECGAEISYKSLLRHRKSKKHLDFTNLK